MQNYKKYYLNEKKYNSFKNKIAYSDLPLFRPAWNSGKVENFFNNDRINISFMGTLYPDFRSAAYLLRMMGPILKDENCILHFFSRGEEKVLARYTNDNTSIISHGFVSRDIATKVKQSTDIFINIANNGVNMTPSKIFEYMSFGKKILHFYNKNEDTSIPYLKRYPYVLMINENDDIQINQNKIKKFLRVQIDLSKLSNKKTDFKMNTPEYTADMIMEALEV